jgi:hypothetical protein
VTAAFLAWFLGCVVVYSALFGTGFLLYGRIASAGVSGLVFVGSLVWLSKTVPRVGFLATADSQ